MVFALGLGGQLVGVTHECDYPAGARGLPVLVKPALPLEQMSQAEIDVAVAARLREGRSLYEIDEDLLRALAPDLILAQDLCQVCAPSGNELSRALTHLPHQPEVLWMTPRTLSGVRENIRALGQATAREAAAACLLADWDRRLAAVAARGAGLARRPRVFCMEWLDPIYCAGHWAPEMVRLAGGHDGLGREGGDSVRVAFQEVIDFAPEVLILMPCGFALPQALEQARLVTQYPGWRDLPAVVAGEVYVVDANAYFARPGPRLVEGAELLGHILAGGSWSGPADALARVDLSAG